ncbi:MAG: transcriptional repressor [Anaerolineaceae bacterium]|nr:transcriptional repressor [Anaerolineaceae bacterium]
MSCEKLFFEEMKKRGYRITPQREMVLAIMHKLEEPSTVEDIFSHVQDISKSVDISTVYRTLELLQEFNLVSEIDTGDRQAKFVLVHDHSPHLHLVCKSCGKISGIHLQNIKSFSGELENQLDFQIDWQDVTFHGLCSTCKQK